METKNNHRSDILVFTDGSCIGNELKNDNLRQAGIGIFFPGNKDFNVSEPLAIPPYTNNRAEMYAVIKCLLVIMTNREYFDRFYTRNITICTDSQFTINVLTQWLPKWKKNGFKTGAKKPVKNKDLVVLLDNTVEQAKSQGYNITFKHVRAHKTEPECGHDDPKWVEWYCNDAADKLALRGSAQLKEKRD